MEDKNRQEPKDEELEKQVLATRPARPGFVAKKLVNFLGKHWDLSPFKHKAIGSMVLVYMLALVVY